MQVEAEVAVDGMDNEQRLKGGTGDSVPPGNFFGSQCRANPAVTVLMTRRGEISSSGLQLTEDFPEEAQGKVLALLFV